MALTPAAKPIGCGTTSGCLSKANTPPTYWLTSANGTQPLRPSVTKTVSRSAWITSGIGAQSCKAVPHDSPSSVVGVVYPCPDRLACNSWLDDQGRTHGD